MAIVKLTDYECRKDLLPKVCMFCGERATSRKQKTFSWYPPWVVILVLAGVLIAAIVAMILTKKMTVRVPVCDEHEGYWRRRGWTLGLSFLGLCFVGVGVIVFMANQGPGNDDVTGWACLGSFGLFLVWLVFAAIYGNRGVRPTEITDRFARFTNVSQDFVDALEDDRERDREEEEELRRERRAKCDAVRDVEDRGPPPKRKPPRDEDDFDRRSRS